MKSLTDEIREILELFDDHPKRQQEEGLQAILKAIKDRVPKGDFFVDGQDEFEKGTLYGYNQAIDEMKKVIGGGEDG